jgi:hypothetical protein
MKTDRFYFDTWGNIYECMANGQVRTLVHDENIDRDDAASIVKALNSHRDWALALQSLTPGGSEYVDDPKRCVETIRVGQDGIWKALCKFKDDLDKARAQRDALRAALVTIMENPESDWGDRQVAEEALEAL